MRRRGEIATNGAGITRGRIWITLDFLNEDMINIIRTINSLENLIVLIDGVTKTCKYKIKKQAGWFLRMLLGTLGISVEGNTLPEYVVRANICVVKPGRGYNNMDHMDKRF